MPQESNYEELDPGIRRTVKLLNDNGFRTSDSGDGSKYPEMACAVDYPMIVIPVAAYDGIWVADEGFDLLKYYSKDDVDWEPGEDHPYVQVEFNYLPYYYGGFVIITNFSDKDLKDGV